jgi:hypothetical protein
VSKIGKVAMALVVVAGIAVAVIAYFTGRDSTDGQEALVIPFVIFWTILALCVVWAVDQAIRAMWRNFVKPV